MTRVPIALGGLALALLLLPAAARADLVPWMYDWSHSPDQINADAPGTGYIALSDQSLKSAVGNSDIVAANLRTYSMATPDRPDRFTARAYTLSLFLFDVDSGLGGTVAFTGQFDGTMTGSSSTIKNTFTGQTAQQIVLGNHLYKATIGPYSPPGPPGQVNAGSISGRVSITVEALPEPGALALSALGLTLLGLSRWRRRRALAKPQAAAGSPLAA